MKVPAAKTYFSAGFASSTAESVFIAPSSAACILAAFERDYIGPALYMSVHRCRHPAEAPE
jgi:hypothetical protein